MDKRMMSFGEMRNRLIDKATEDEAFRARLMADPKAAVEAEIGVAVPAGFMLKVHEDTADTSHLVLPPPADATLSEADLEQVSGGIRWGGAPENPNNLVGKVPLCFRPDALVRLADGRELPAGEIRLGDELRSPEGAAPVVSIYQDAREKPWVSVNGREPFFTGSHPVVTQRGEVPGASLRPGDVLTLAGGVAEVVRTVDVVRLAQPNVNVETEGSMPYFVNGVLFGSYMPLALAHEDRSADVRAA